VLLVEDTWVSGSSAQSAAVALRGAGARHVAVVVLGRHVDPADPRSAGLLARMAATGYDGSTCAVHVPPGNLRNAQ
jgi:orotate phosphoribosyltransferase